MILNNGYPIHVEVTAEKLRQLTKQHRRYIKQDVPLNTASTFLQLAESCADPYTNGSGKQQEEAETVYLPWL